MEFSNVNMSQSPFGTAHGLKQIVLDNTVELASAPFPNSRRRCVIDEVVVRQKGSGVRAWLWRRYFAKIVPVHNQDDGRRERILKRRVLSRLQVADIYRDMRVSYESRGDHAGANDFYYGEMEMRRLSRDTAHAERFILFFYWILSGYGLRASRAILWLLLTIAAVTYLGSGETLIVGGKGYWDSLLFSLKALLPGIGPAATLTPIGEFTNVGLRIWGPALLALAVLAVRGRIKR
jgi:hypothetical protein